MYFNNSEKEINKETLLKQHEELAKNGYRVIALAKGKNIDGTIKNLTFILKRNSFFIKKF